MAMGASIASRHSVCSPMQFKQNYKKPPHPCVLLSTLLQPQAALNALLCDNNNWSGKA